MNAHPNTVIREKQEKIGGCWLAVYIEAEPCVVSGATLRCFYCGFGHNEGHDFACRYLWHADKLPTRGKAGTTAHIILVPKGGVPPSESMF